MEFSAWFEAYLTLYKRKIAPKTRESYARLYLLLSPLHGTPLDQLTPDQLQAALIGVEIAAGSRQAQLAYTLLHACLRRAVRSRHLQYNPAVAIDKPEHDTKAGRAICAADWQRLLPEIEADAAFALMAFAGLRRGELLALRREDIDLPAGVIHVTKQRLRVGGRLAIVPPKSAAAVRDVPILPELAGVLRQLPLMHPATLVCSCSPETLARRWRRAQEREGIVQPYRLHDLRHTYATRLVAKGCNLRILQYMIGHSSYQLTAQTYTHIGAFEAKSEVNRLFAALH